MFRKDKLQVQLQHNSNGNASFLVRILFYSLASQTQRDSTRTEMSKPGRKTRRASRNDDHRERSAKRGAYHQFGTGFQTSHDEEVVVVLADIVSILVS